MKRKGSLYGWMGCLSLLGLIGIFSEEKLFLTFFAFAVDFEYFFMRSDEMLEEYMNRSAARAFYWGMLTAGLAALAGFFLGRVGAQAGACRRAFGRLGGGSGGLCPVHSLLWMQGKVGPRP